MALEHQKTLRSTLLKIAHRGNRSGKTKSENQLWYLKEAIAEGYDVEADVWMFGGRLWLGHNGPMYLLSETDLTSISNSTWFHCKNFDALNYFINNHQDKKFFWHQNDNHALTSNGLIWTYPGKEVGPNSIIVDFNNDRNYDILPYGICSDKWISID